MAIRTATKSGNLSDSTVWGAAFADGDIPVLNGFNIALDVNKIIGTSPPMRPSGAGFSVAATGSGATLATGTYYVGYTDVNANGESTMCPFVSVSITLGQTASVTLPALPTGVVSRSIYFSDGVSNPTNSKVQASGIVATGAAAYVQSTAVSTAGASERSLGAIVDSLSSVITVNTGVTVTVRGDINFVNGWASTLVDKLILVGSAHLAFDSSAAIAPTATAYQSFGDGMISLNGSSGSRFTLDSVTTGGAKAGRLLCTKVHGQYGTVTLGDASNGGLQPASLSGANYGLNLSNVIFDTGGDITTQGNNVGAAADWSLVNCSFKNSLGPTNFSNGMSAPSTGARSVAGTVFDKTPNFGSVQGFTLDDAIFLNGYQGGSAATNATQWTSAQRVLYQQSLAAPDVSPVAGPILDWVAYQSDLTSNPHFLQLSSGVLDTSIDGLIAEYAGTDNSGDVIVTSSATPTRTVSVKRCIKIPNASGASTGCLINTTGPGNTYTVEHNTVHLGGSGGGGSGIVIGETAAGNAGLIASDKSNIYWDSSARDPHMLALTGIGAPAVDTCAPTATDYNASWNETSPATNTVNGVGGVALRGYSNMNFSATPATHSINANPQFVDAARNLASWDLLLGGPGTGAHAVAEMAKRNDAAGFNASYTLANYRTYSKAGYAPTNVALHNAGHDGTDIGAVAYVATGPTAGQALFYRTMQYAASVAALLLPHVFLGARHV